MSKQVEVCDKFAADFESMVAYLESRCVQSANLRVRVPPFVADFNQYRRSLGMDEVSSHYTNFMLRALGYESGREIIGIKPLSEFQYGEIRNLTAREMEGVSLKPGMMATVRHGV